MDAEAFGKEPGRDRRERAVDDTPTPTPIAISVNMFGLRLTIDAHARTKNGQPAQKTTGVASASPIQFTSRMPTTRDQRPAERPCPPSSSTNTGSAERERQPEAPRHVDQLGVRLVLERDDARLERHPADRARARLVADDLRVHRAGVFDLVSAAGSDRSGSSAMPHFGHAPGSV